MTTEAIRKILTRDFILAFFAQFAFTLANHILIPTLPIYLSRLGSRATEIGVLIGIFTVSSLVLRPFTGKILLRTPEKKMMVIGALLFGLTSIGYLVALPFWPFFIVRLSQGIGYAFYYTASFTLIANISPEAHRGQSLSYFLLALNISLALGPSLGMFLINRFDFTTLFLVGLGLSFISFFIISRLGQRPVVPVETSSAVNRFFISQEALPASTMSFFFFFIWGAITVFFPLYAIKHGMVNPGLFFTMIAVMIISSRVLGARISDLYSTEKIIVLCLVILVVATVIIAFSRTLSMFVLAGLIWGVGHAFLYPALVVFILDRVGSSRSLAMGTLTAMTDLGIFMGPVVMGVVVQFTGYPAMFLGLSLIGIFSLVYFQFFVRDKKVPTAPSKPILLSSSGGPGEL
jgi:MFS family permease